MVIRVLLLFVFSLCAFSVIIPCRSGFADDAGSGVPGASQYSSGTPSSGWGYSSGNTSGTSSFGQGSAPGNTPGMPSSGWGNATGNTPGMSSFGQGYAPGNAPGTSSSGWGNTSGNARGTSSFGQGSAPGNAPGAPSSGWGNAPGNTPGMSSFGQGYAPGNAPGTSSSGWGNTPGNARGASPFGQGYAPGNAPGTSSSGWGNTPGNSSGISPFGQGYAPGNAPGTPSSGWGNASGATQGMPPFGQGSSSGTMPGMPSGGEMGRTLAFEPSSIEKAFLESGNVNDRTAQQPLQVQQVTQYGYSFFKPSASGFAPLTDVPVGPDYVVGPGDTLVLSAWGSLNATGEFEVNRNGEIVLPKVGNVKVLGVPFGRLRDHLRTNLSKIYKDFDLSITMGKLRVIKVFVVGEVNAPGDYNLTSLSTVINALGAAGGPLKTGSLRNIQVKRGGRVVETVDLYDFFLKGDKSRDIRLQPGDTIFVPVIGKVAAIAGNVKRPAIYELKEEKTLGDLVALSEGFLPTGYLQRVQVYRVDAHEKKKVSDFDINPRDKGKPLDVILSGVKIQDMDAVTIFPINKVLRDHIRLQGYVLRPGDYELKPGMRLKDLFKEKDSLLPEYYNDVCQITRISPPDNHPEILTTNLSRALAGDDGQNILLKESDEIRVFSRWEMEEMPKVRIYGDVQRPGDYRLFQNMMVRDLLFEAGNVRTTAYTKNAELSRLNRSGENVTSFPIIINLEEAIRGNPRDNLKLEPFDELVVRKIPNWVDETERYVELKGEVRFPGVYPIYRGERLSSVVERAGGYTEKAYLRGAKFTRKTVQADQQKHMEMAISRAQDEILRMQADLAATATSKDAADSTKVSLEALQKSLEKLKAARAEGRVVIQLAQLDELKKSRYNVELVGGDSLHIPPVPSEVNIMGQVYNQTAILYTEGESVSYYLNKAGGPTSDAEADEMYIIKTDGTVTSKQQSTMGFHWNNATNTWDYGTFLSSRMEPGDTLIVPQRLEKTAWIRDIKDITTILSQIALAAGVVVAAGL